MNTVVKKMDIMTESHHQIFKILWHLGEENRKYMEEAKSRDNNMRRAMANIQRDLQEQLRRLGYKVDKSAARPRREAEVINQIKAGVDAMNEYLDDEDFRTNLEEYHRQNVEKWLAERKRLDERGIIQERPSVAASGGRRDERGDGVGSAGQGESDGKQEVRRPRPRRRTGGVEADVIEVVSSEEEEPPKPQKAIRSAGAPGKPSRHVDNLAAAMEEAGVSTPEEAQAAGDQQLEELLAHMSPEDDGESEDGTNTSGEEPTERAGPGSERGGAGDGGGPREGDQRPRDNSVEARPKEVEQREPTAEKPEEGEQKPRDNSSGARPKEGGQRESTAAEPEEVDKRP